VSHRSLCTVLTALVPALVVAHSVRADVQKGVQIARQWCANCHVIDGRSADAVPQGPPTFPSVARSGMTNDQLRAFLTHPHGAMPDLALTRAEIDDLIGYIGALR
jgi:mono/diheme cytochrome c family protein